MSRSALNGRRRRLGWTMVAVVATTLGLAGPASATDTLPWTGASAAGLNQPYQHGYSAADLLRWDPAEDQYAPYLRARVPLQKRIGDVAATQRDPELSPRTQMFNLSGDYGNAFFESQQNNNEFSQYAFSYWQYADYYASWHGMPTAGVPRSYYDPNLDYTQKFFEFGMLNLPNPAYTNAAHRNGVKSLGCIFFSSNDRGDQWYKQLLVRGADGRFPVADKLTQVAKYFGFDGYFVNQEELTGVAQGDIGTYMDFLKQLRDSGMYIQWYDSTDSTTGALDYENAFNKRNSAWVKDPQRGRITDSMFLNYWWSQAGLRASSEHAKKLGLDPLQTVFTGVEAGANQFNNGSLAATRDTDGSPLTSIASLGADFVSADYADKTNDDAQATVFDRERRWWTGSSTGSTTPDAGSWPGIAQYITARSPIGGRVFHTDFNTGHGLSSWVDGRLSNNSEWADLNRQDVPTSWQWWIDSSSSTPLQADYDYGPRFKPADRFGYTPIGGYNSGSSLVLNGRLAADNTVRLYRTDLTTTRGTRAELTYRKLRSDTSTLQLAVVLASDPSKVTRISIPGSGTATNGWHTATVDLSAFAGQRIASLGVTVARGAKAVDGYQLNLGALTVTDGAIYRPSRPVDFRLDENLTGSRELFASWRLAPYSQVHSYELYLDSTLLGAGYDSVRYIKNLPAQTGTLRLVAVGPDGSRSVAATVRLDGTTVAKGLKVDAGGSGKVTVSWVAPHRQWRTVTIASVGGEILRRALVPGGRDSVTFAGLPTDGSEYVTKVQVGAGVPTAVRGSFADTTITPYPRSSVAIDGTSIAVTPPTSPDWHTLTILENGQPLNFDTTYNQGPRPYIIRGRTTRQAETTTLSSPTSSVVAVLRDYAGNEVTTILRRSK